MLGSFSGMAVAGRTVVVVEEIAHPWFKPESKVRLRPCSEMIFWLHSQLKRL